MPNNLNHNYSISPSEGLLIDGAEDCFDSLCAAMIQAGVMRYADPLTTTLAANSLLVYIGVVSDLSQTPTNGQTVTEPSPNITQRLKPLQRTGRSPVCLSVIVPSAPTPVGCRCGAAMHLPKSKNV